jgi:predicted DNA binding CopG/RHH family protein
MKQNNKQINLSVQQEILDKVKMIAEREGLPYTLMLRNWIIHKVREVKPWKPNQKEALG